jgi:hypothetical protein
VADTCAPRRGLDQTLGSGPVPVLMPGRPASWCDRTRVRVLDR